MNALLIGDVLVHAVRSPAHQMLHEFGQSTLSCSTEHSVPDPTCEGATYTLVGTAAAERLAGIFTEGGVPDLLLALHDP